MKRKVIPFAITPALTSVLPMGFSDDSFQTYLAMKFELPTELSPGIFLERYLKAIFDV